jgi:hypothetical protein
MKFYLSQIIGVKTNIIGTVIIALIASVMTTLTSSYLVSSDKSVPLAAATASLSVASQTSVLDCGSEIYSPVQKTCVSREIFEAEMQRLFTALGIATTAYGLGGDNNK